MYLTKQPNGNYMPTYDADYEESRKIKAGTEVRATRARNAKFHRKAFALLNMGFDNQDQYENFESYRMVITVKAGFVHWIEDKDGKPYALPQSISFNNMNQETFENYFTAILNVISKQLETAPEEIRAEIGSFYN